MLTDSERFRVVKVKQKRRAKDRYWSDEQKIDAVKTFVLLNGNANQAAIVCGIPQQTLQKWTKMQWWKDLLDEFKAEDNLNISMRLQKVLSKSLALMEDRLENGDVFYDQKQGKAVRKDVSLRDAQAVMRDSFIIKEQIEKPQVVLDSQSISDKLTELANKFAELASNKKPSVTVTDVIFAEEKKEKDNAVQTVQEMLDGQTPESL